mmetsp:Transcript_3672/g.5677  ORF Transcript_3672/g.5677 Transcript_3672/m.5677 type:complete len:776 (+) Transcript_3672:225-2552(+)
MKFTEKLFHPWSLFTIVIASSVTLLLPLTFPQGALQNAQGVHSLNLTCIAAAALGLCGPLLFDILMDLSSIKPRTLLPRVLLVLGIILPNACIILEPGISLLYVCLFGTKNLLFAGALMTYLMNSNTSQTQKTMLLVCYWTGVVTIFVIHLGFVVDSIVIYSLIILTAVFLVVEMLTLLYMYFRTMLSAPAETFSSTSKKCNFVYVCCLVFLVFYIHTIWLVFGFQPWDFRTSDELIGYCVCDMVLAVVAICLPTRLMRDESAVLMHKLELTKQFIRYISHELRTPLSTMMLGSQVLSSSAKNIQQEAWQCDEGSQLQSLADTMASTSANVYASCQSAVDVLNGLLVFDKIEDGHLRLRLKLQNLMQSIVGWVEPSELQASEERVNLVYSGAESFADQVHTTIISVDNIKFAIVMRNLISNALKFTPPGGKVTVSARLLGRKEVPEELEHIPSVVRITVKDTGCGIPPENQSKLFKDVVQFSATEARNGEGSGLGLYVSRNIVRKHGGLLSLESSGIPGEGCAFHIDLPTADEYTVSKSTHKLSCQLVDKGSSGSSTPIDDNELNSVRSKPTATNLCCQSHDDFVRYSTKKVNRIVPVCSDQHEDSGIEYHTALVVDDVKTCRKMLSRVLKPYFENIIEKEDGVGAVEAVKESFVKENIDMIFLDSVMPNMSGIEACKLIRTMGFRGPIVAVTGNIVPEDVEEFLAAGADKLVGKPMKLETLVTTLDEFKYSSRDTTRRVFNCESAVTPTQHSFAADEFIFGQKAMVRDYSLEEV